MNQLTLVTSDFHETLQRRLLVTVFKSVKGIFDLYCESKDMADLLNLQRKLELLTLTDRINASTSSLSTKDLLKVPKEFC